MSLDTHRSIYNLEKLTNGIDRIEQHFFYFERSSKRNAKTMLVDTTHNEYDEKQELGSNLIASDFKMNNNYCIFWNSDNVWYITFDVEQRRYVQKQLDYTIKDESIKIHDVRVGSNSHIIAIVLQISSSYDCVVIWNLEKGEEKGLFDVQRGYEILWDK